MDGTHWLDTMDISTLNFVSNWFIFALFQRLSTILKFDYFTNVTFAFLCSHLGFIWMAVSGHPCYVFHKNETMIQCWKVAKILVLSNVLLNYKSNERNIQKTNFIVDIILISSPSTIRNLCELKTVDALL